MRPEEVIRTIEDYFGVVRGAIAGPKRTQFVSKARNAAIIYLRDYNKLSYAEIGGWLNKHHTSVMCAYKTKKADRVSWFKLLVWKLWK